MAVATGTGKRRQARRKNRAAVVLAEAEIPRGIAEAFRSGNLGVMDYYKLKNVQADTQMREAVAGSGNGSQSLNDLAGHFHSRKR